MTLTQDSPVVCSDGHVLTVSELRLHDAVRRKMSDSTYRLPLLEFFFGKKTGWFEIVICLPGADLPSEREEYRLEVEGINPKYGSDILSIRRVFRLLYENDGIDIRLCGVDCIDSSLTTDEFVYFANCKFHVPKV